MPQRLLLIVDDTLSVEGMADARELCRGFAEFMGEQIAMLVVPAGRVDEIRAAVTRAGDVQYVGILGPAGSASPMSSAPFVWREDGRPDWGAMWTGFCELALFGGPPHRGDAQALVADPTTAPPVAGSEMIAEVIRGIAETTGLYAEVAEPGWVAVHCLSPKQAAWMAACIVLENVEAHADGELLYLPARADYELKDQVKSLITVVAKTNHYWQAHLAGDGMRLG